MAIAKFKSDQQNQLELFPFEFGSLIEKTHPVRLINSIIDELDITDILRLYRGGGASSYHPRMMLKVLIYAYLNNIYSSRKMAKAMRENVYFIWLSGQQFPDFRTLNLFRGKRLKDSISCIFKQVVLLLQAEGYVTLEEVFTDGTKIESTANRYTFVWKKSVEKFKERLENKIRAVLDEIDTAIRQDDQDAECEENSELANTISSEELNKKVEEINQKLKTQDVSKQIKKNAETLEKEFLPKLIEYEVHLNIMGDRNSYSKTDHDATFMRMKEDHMKNGQLKPAYNVQISTENNFVTNYTNHQTPGDTTTFKTHLDTFNQHYKRFPNRSIADAGYGSLENYDYLESKNIDNFVKYNYFHKEQEKKFKLDIARPENLYYNEENDYYICPMGQRMLPVYSGERETSTGYKYPITIYQTQNCSNCPLRGACHKQSGNRKMEINTRLIRHKQKARNNLTSDLGKELRGRRCSEVEQTFGQIKWNKKFNRFLLRGLPKISIEIGLIALAHNFEKLSKCLIKQNIGHLYLKPLDPYMIIRTWLTVFKKKFTQNTKLANPLLKPRNILLLDNYKYKKAA
ncbi:MAG: IS1182 family transposase [Vicingaceae bacterium]|nr:IS1182 family transposase [Vicingaceae bacterium]